MAEKKGKDVMVKNYESESYINLDYMRMFEKGFTRTVVIAEGPSYILEIPSDLNLQQDMVELVPQFYLFCSTVESGAL